MSGAHPCRLSGHLNTHPYLLHQGSCNGMQLSLLFARHLYMSIIFEPAAPGIHRLYREHLRVAIPLKICFCSSLQNWLLRSSICLASLTLAVSSDLLSARLGTSGFAFQAAASLRLILLRLQSFQTVVSRACSHKERGVVHWPENDAHMIARQLSSLKERRFAQSIGSTQHVGMT